MRLHVERQAHIGIKSSMASNRASPVLGVKSLGKETSSNGDARLLMNYSLPGGTPPQTPVHLEGDSVGTVCRIWKSLDIRSKSLDCLDETFRSKNCSCEAIRHREEGSYNFHMCGFCDSVENAEGCPKNTFSPRSWGTVPQKRKAEAFSSGITSLDEPRPTLSGSDGELCPKELVISQNMENLPFCGLDLRRSSVPVSTPQGPQCANGCGTAENNKMRNRLDFVCAMCHKNGFSSLERLNRNTKPMCSKGKPLKRSKPFRFSVPDSSDGEGTVSDSEFVRNRKDRSTVLVRRYLKNNQKFKKTVCTGTKAIVKTLPTGCISDRIWESVCNERSRHEASGHSKALQAIQLQVSRALLAYPGARLAEIDHAAPTLSPEVSLLHRSRKLLAQAVSWPPVSPSQIRFRACHRRISIAAHLSGALLEATAALGARTSLPSFTVGSTGRAMLKGKEMYHFSV